MTCADCTDSYTEILRESEGHGSEDYTDAPDPADGVFDDWRNPWLQMSDDEKAAWNAAYWGEVA